MDAKSRPRRFLRLPEVIHISGCGRTSIYEKIKTGKFPKPYPLGARAVGWLAEDITGLAAANAYKLTGVMVPQWVDEARGETAMEAEFQKARGRA